MNLKFLKYYFNVVSHFFDSSLVLIKIESRNIDLTILSYLDSDFNFISVESVNKLLKQSDLFQINLLKSNLNLKEIERIIYEINL